MADIVDFREEAKECVQLAQIEAHPEVKTVLMGMALGWLTLADHKKTAAGLRYESDDA
jgi:hypothetical protein